MNYVKPSTFTLGGLPSCGAHAAIPLDDDGDCYWCLDGADPVPEHWFRVTRYSGRVWHYILKDERLELPTRRSACRNVVVPGHLYTDEKPKAEAILSTTRPLGQLCPQCVPIMLRDCWGW